MNEREVLELLARVAAVINGHFVFTFGKHGSTYFNKDAVYPRAKDVPIINTEVGKGREFLACRRS